MLYNVNWTPFHILKWTVMNRSCKYGLNIITKKRKMRGCSSEFLQLNIKFFTDEMNENHTQYSYKDNLTRIFLGIFLDWFEENIEWETVLGTN